METLHRGPSHVVAGGGDGVVYFGSYSGSFYAVDAVSGKLKWKFQTEGERRFEGKHLHGSQPAAETDARSLRLLSVVPGVVERSSVFRKRRRERLRSGRGHRHAEMEISHRRCRPRVSGDLPTGRLFIGSWDSYFYALDAASGKEKWRFKTGEDHDIYNQVGIQSSAAVMDGVVYFGCRDSNFYALDARTGEKKWAFNNKGSWVITSPAVQAGKVYFATSDIAPVLRAWTPRRELRFSL